MKKRTKSITNPDELNKNLQYSSPITWIILSIVFFLLVGFFAWSFLYKIQITISGNAIIYDGVATLHIEKRNIRELEIGQKVYIADQEGEILSIDDEGNPNLTTFTLEDGEYKYTIYVRETSPIEFLIK